MGLSAAVIDALVQAGATVEQLAAAVKADLAEGEQRIAEKRAKDAARQRKSRASRAVTVTPCDTTDAAPNDIYSNPLKPSEPKGSSGKTPAKKSIKTLLPDDWTPPPVSELTPKARACAEQWTRENYETVAEAFALYWRREQKKTADWLLTFCGWIIREHSKIMRDQKFGNGAPAERKRDERPLTNEELKRAIQFNEDQGNQEKAAAYRFQLQARTALSAGVRP